MKKGVLPTCNAVSRPLELSRPCKQRIGSKILPPTGNTDMKREPDLSATDTFFPHPIWLQNHTLLSSTAVSPRFQSARPNNKGDAFQEKALYRQFFILQEKGKQSQPYRKLTLAFHSSTRNEIHTTLRSHCCPASPEERHSQAVHADIQRSAEVFQGLTCRNAPSRHAPEHCGRRSD